MADAELKIHFPLPVRKEFRLGILYSPGPLADCQLAAYQQGGFRVEAIASEDFVDATTAANRFKIPKAFVAPEQLLDDSNIEVLVMAGLATEQPALIKAASSRKTVKGILAATPLAANYVEAADVVKACEESGLALAVNQPMRFDYAVRGARTLLKSGRLGEPITALASMLLRRSLPIISTSSGAGLAIRKAFTAP